MAFFASRRDARGNQLLLVGVLADNLGDRTALLRVDVLLDLLRLSLLLQLADLFLLVVANLTLLREGDALAHLLANLLLVPVARLARDLAGSRVAFGLLLAAATRRRVAIGGSGSVAAARLDCNQVKG